MNKTNQEKIKAKCEQLLFPEVKNSKWTSTVQLLESTMQIMSKLNDAREEKFSLNYNFFIVNKKDIQSLFVSFLPKPKTWYHTQNSSIFFCRLFLFYNIVLKEN